MAQDAADVKAARDAASKYGRVNRREYSKLAGTPMEKASVMPNGSLSLSMRHSPLPQNNRHARLMPASA